MGEPVRILELAENLIRLSGLKPYEDVPIVFSGLRPGEKLHEELTYHAETTVSTSLADVRVVEAGEAGGISIVKGISRLGECLDSGDPDDLRLIIKELVPEYRLPIMELPRRLGPLVEVAAGT
jgi:FlaA1/EpsC-like NDP-sugar epimerase